MKLERCDARELSDAVTLNNIAQLADRLPSEPQHNGDYRSTVSWLPIYDICYKLCTTNKTQVFAVKPVDCEKCCIIQTA